MNKIKTLLINPVIGFSPPLGLLYIAALLEKNFFQVRVVELNTYTKNNYDFSEIIQEIEQNDYKIVGITCLTSSIGVVKSFIKTIKSKFVDLTIVVGGPHATVLPEQLLEAGADISVIGEGESIFLEIVKRINQREMITDIPSIVFKSKEKGSIIRTPPRETFEDVNLLPFPAYHLINMEHYISKNYAIRGYWLRCGWIFTARGCPAKCTFCASKAIHGYHIRERNIQDVLDELELLKNNYRMEAFWILDDTFILKEKRVIEFCEGLLKRRLSFIWGCQSRVSYFTETIAKNLKQAGCVQVDFGVESGSPKVLKAIKKGITVDQTKKAFATAHGHKLRALGTIMIGNPEETWEDIMMTKRLLEEIKPDYLGIGFATPYPGTELYQQAIDNNWIDVSNLRWDTDGHNDRPVMFINFNAQELNQIYSLLVSKSFFKTIFNYLHQKDFILDMLKLILHRPYVALKLLSLLVRGEKKSFINSFRKYRLTGSI